MQKLFSVKGAGLIAAVAAFGTASLPAVAAEKVSFAGKRIEVIVPFAPGGGSGSNRSRASSHSTPPIMRQRQHQPDPAADQDQHDRQEKAALELADPGLPHFRSFHIVSFPRWEYAGPWPQCAKGLDSTALRAIFTGCIAYQRPRPHEPQRKV